MRVFRFCLLFLCLGLSALMPVGSSLAENYDPLRAGVVKVLSEEGRVGTGFVVQLNSDGA